MCQEYIIHLDDYLRHIDEKLRLYIMLTELTELACELPDCAKTEELKSLARTYDKVAYEMWRSWDCLDLYREEGSNRWLDEVMENELLPVDEVETAPVRSKFDEAVEKIAGLFAQILNCCEEMNG